eukprot:TRINITY_DN27459_c0_g2_i2.p1 TRINITY_DN27459_c0_g2~~TRINITY_DN27459_c0_g2_i2.p1  ORF type:complete len:568 (+),score=184.68 TRINITY_DN27459_c0_g2_i2:186-1889(+)
MELHLSNNELTDTGVRKLVEAAYACGGYPRDASAPALVSLGKDSRRRALWLRAEHCAVQEADTLLESLRAKGFEVAMQAAKDDRLPPDAVVQMHPSFLPAAGRHTGNGSWSSASPAGGERQRVAPAPALAAAAAKAGKGASGAKAAGVKAAGAKAAEGKAKGGYDAAGGKSSAAKGAGAKAAEGKAAGAKGAGDAGAKASGAKGAGAKAAEGKGKGAGEAAGAKAAGGHGAGAKALEGKGAEGKAAGAKAGGDAAGAKASAAKAADGKAKGKGGRDRGGARDDGAGWGGSKGAGAGEAASAPAGRRKDRTEGAAKHGSPVPLAPRAAQTLRRLLERAGATKALDRSLRPDWTAGSEWQRFAFLGAQSLREDCSRRAFETGGALLDEEGLSNVGDVCAGRASLAAAFRNLRLRPLLDAEGFDEQDDKLCSAAFAAMCGELQEKEKASSDVAVATRAIADYVFFTGLGRLLQDGGNVAAVGGDWADAKKAQESAAAVAPAHASELASTATAAPAPAAAVPTPSFASSAAGAAGETSRTDAPREALPQSGNAEPFDLDAIAAALGVSFDS